MGKKSARSRLVKSGGKAQSIILSDGTELPVGRPAGISDAQYEQVLEQLKQNPEMAREQMDRAHALLRGSPMMAQAMLTQQRVMSDPAYAESLSKLKEDPELKSVFEEIQSSGPEALSKYWDDTEMLSRIASKMAQLRPPSSAPAAAAGPKAIESVHDAAKAGDLEALGRFLGEDNSAADRRDERGITPLGVAVGFNRVAAVRALIAAGADPNLADGKGNAPLHYACGYGREEAAGLLLDAGADPARRNDDGQTPLDVARLNKETALEKLMQRRCPDAGADPGSPYV